jgi:hypothetical protein
MASTILGVALSASLVTPPEPRKNELPRDLAWLAGGATVDLVGTEFGLARNPGAYEMNPLGQTTGKRMAVKLGSIVVVGLVCRELRKDGHDKAARWVAIVGGGAWAAAGTANVLRDDEE